MFSDFQPVISLLLVCLSWTEVTHFIPLTALWEAVSLSLAYLVNGDIKDNKEKIDCVIGALNKTHRLIQDKSMGFIHLWPILSFCHRPIAVLDGLNRDHGRKARPQSGHRPTLDLGKSLSLDVSNKIRENI